MNQSTIFSTSLWEYSIDYDKEKIVNALSEVRENKPTNQTIYINGYQSPPHALRNNEVFDNIFANAVDCAKKASMDLLFAPCRCFITAAYANISDNRSSFTQDKVFGETFTAIFFVKQTENSGRFSLSNPLSSNYWNGENFVVEKNMMTCSRIHIKPTEGQMILFPSYIPYSIEPNLDDETSMSIIISINVVPLTQINEKDT